MLQVFIVTAIILLIGVIAMAFKVLFIKGGRFSSTHIGSSKVMKDNKIPCATTQDRMAQQSAKTKKQKTYSVALDVEIPENEALSEKEESTQS